MIRGTVLPRRTILRGAGVSLALPLLDAMVPAFAAAPAPVRRFAAVYVPMGMHMDMWRPEKAGPLELSPILQPLAAFKDRVVIASGLASKEADVVDSGVHARVQATWLTGCRARRTEGPDLYLGPSLDQLIARELSKETQLASLEVALESVDLIGACQFGYSCAYNSTIAWRDATTPLPMEVNPRAVFERLFGSADSTDPRVRGALARRRRSILDFVGAKASSLSRGVGAGDRLKLDQYLTAVRDVERRIQKAEEQAGQELPVVEQPVGIPATFEEHSKLLWDLVALAYQADLTRVATYAFGREQSNLTFPEVGVPESHHALSHHQNNPEKLARLAKLQTFEMKLFAHFLEKLQSIPDGDGTLLDNTMVLHGSGMSNSNLHYPYELPTMVVAGKGFAITGGRHHMFDPAKQVPLANLQLSLLEKMGMRMEKFGDSNGELNLLSV